GRRHALRRGRLPPLERAVHHRPPRHHRPLRRPTRPVMSDSTISPTARIATTAEGHIDPTLPEVVSRILEAGAHLESIRLDRLGRWWHRGEPRQNARLIALCSRSVGRTPGGTRILHIAPFTYPIEVEDTGYFVHHIAIDPDSAEVR